MHVIGIDLGGTKLASAIFTSDGSIVQQQTVVLEKKSAENVGAQLVNQILALMSLAHSRSQDIRSIGISVPGIYFAETGTVWAPNIPGWDNYPLQRELQALPELNSIQIKIDSDRACYILGETWQGAARGCKNAIFLAVGTGIGAGILVDGRVLRGHGDIAGAVGWMALNHLFRPEYQACGCFEYHAAGDGIARIAREYLQQEKHYQGLLRQKLLDQVSSHDVFQAYAEADWLAKQVLDDCIQFWGMAIANLISSFNPEKIILGGGVFGPAAQFLTSIKQEAQRWAQPISMQQVSIEISALGSDAGLYGAGHLAIRAVPEP